MFVKSTRFKQVCQLLLSLIVALFPFHVCWSDVHSSLMGILVRVLALTLYYQHYHSSFNTIII